MKCRGETKIPTPSDFRRAIEIVKNGGIVAFPTETFYGLAVDIRNEEGLDKLFAIKKRDKNKPILVLVPSKDKLKCLVQYCPSVFKPLIKKYWPGALTIIFPAELSLSKVLTGNTNSIGVRMSSHPVASEFVIKYGNAISATSANISTMPPATNADEVRKMFGDNIDYILDGGQTEGLKPSTIICQEKGRIDIIRKGAIEIMDN